MNRDGWQTSPAFLSFLLGLSLFGIAGFVWWHRVTVDPEVERFKELVERRRVAEVAGDKNRVRELEERAILVLADRLDGYRFKWGGEESIRLMLAALFPESFEEVDDPEVVPFARRLATYIRLDPAERRKVLEESKRAVEAELSKLGVPKGYDSLLTPIPENENAADLYLEAMKLADGAFDYDIEIPFDPEYLAEQLTADEIRAAAERVLEANASVIQKVREASARPRCRYPSVPETGTLTLRFLVDLNELVKIVSSCAIANAHLADADTAHRLCALTFRTVESGFQNPSTANYPMQTVMISIAINTLSEVCRVFPPTPDQEKTYREFLGRIDAGVLGADAIRGEACLQIFMMENGILTQNPRAEYPEDRTELPTFERYLERAFPDFEEPAVVAVLLENAERYGFSFFSKLIRTLKMGCREARGEVAGWTEEEQYEMKGLLYFLCMIESEVRLAQTALDCYRFRRETERWPNDLDELASRLKIDVPEDPYTGEPIRYRNGVLYCLGENGEDESDQELPEDDRRFRLK